MTPKQREALEAFERHGGYRPAARALGIDYKTLRKHVDAARKYMEADDGIRGAMAETGLADIGKLHSGWLKTDGASLYFQQPKDGSDQVEDLVERFRTAFENLTSAEPIAAPETVMGDLCSVYPLMDVHLGMYAWGRETSSVDYDVKLATRDMRQAFAKVMALTPPSTQGILIVGGDFFHADNNNSETPASRHKLDTDGRFDKVIDAGISILVETVDRLLGRHKNVIVRVLRGNHDENAFRLLRVALAAWYRNEPRVTIDSEPRDLFMFQWGACALFAHHGDKANPQQAALYVSDICTFWSATRHRHFLTGHVHHDQAKDVGPLRWESLRAFCPPDAYAASMGYGARRALQSLTFHKVDGLVLRCTDPIDRVA